MLGFMPDADLAPAGPRPAYLKPIFYSFKN
jgi:hypothetical protein